MRFDIKRLTRAGFHVSVDEDSITIAASPVAAGHYQALKEKTSEHVGDPGLQQFVLDAYFTALHRAQILEIAE